MVDAATWATAPTPAPPVEPVTSEWQAVAVTGGRTLCEQAGVDYATLDAGSQAHYQQIALTVYAAMWDTAFEVNPKVSVEHLDTTGTPVEVAP